VSNDSHVFCAVSLSQAGLIFTKGHIEHPVEAILDGPVAAHSLGGTEGRESCGRHIVAGFETTAVFELGPRSNSDDCRNVGQAEFARETAITVEPVDLVGDGDGALLDAP